MKKSISNLFWIPVVLILLIAFQIIIHSPEEVTDRNAVKGVLNLSNWNNANIINLTGEWQLYDGLMIDEIGQAKKLEYAFIPNLFAKKPELGGNPYGVASYKLTITGLDPQECYGVHILSEASAYRLTVNGKNIIEAGTVAKNKQGHEPQVKSRLGDFRSDSNGKAELLIEISNFSYNYGGFWNPVQLGENKKINSYIMDESGRKIFLFACILIIGLFFMGLYMVNRGYKPLFYFSIICILMAMRIMLTDYKQFYDFLFNVSWNLGTRLEFLSGYLMVPCYGLFFLNLDYVKKYKYIAWVFHGFIITSFLIMIFTPNEFYQNLLPNYLMLCIVSLIFFLYIILQGIRKKKPGAWIMLIGTSSLIPFIIHDFYINTKYTLVPFGTFVMLIFFSIVVLKNFFMIKSKYEYLEEAIMIDPLTGLKNRYFINKLMNDGLNTALENSSMYILFFDLNKFKQINDIYGHNVGDEVLKESASRIKSCFRQMGDMVCRYGGDEFIAFVEMIKNDDNISQMIDRIQTKFSEPILVAGKPLYVSVSIGISVYDPGKSLEKVIIESDKAMYQAKKANPEGVTIVEGKVMVHQRA